MPDYKKIKAYLAKKHLVIVLFAALSLFAFKADDYFEISKNLDIFVSVYKEINTSYVDEVKPGELIRAAIDGMLKSLDPYTNFYSEAQTEDYRYEVTGTYAGIGSTIRTVDDYVAIESPYDNYPAQKAGLLPGDKILEIDGVSMKGKTSNQVTDYLKGNAGTAFNMKIERYGAGELTKTITREQITMKNVPYYGMVDKKVGYIELTGFTPNAGKEVRDAVIALKAEGAQSLILDLRNNGGGLLFEAINIVNVFVNRGETIVVTKGKYPEDNQTLKTLNSPVDVDIPLIVMINGNSASASEIVSGSLQDLDRAVLVGRNSYGKGLVQSTKPLTYNTQMKITTAKYYIPSGRLIQRLDYGNKVNGKAIAVADSAKQQFKTRNGRAVVDGEGIQPDVLVAEEAYSKIAQSLLQNNLTFKYANVFKSKNETIVKPTDFDISEDVLADFEKYLRDKDYTYITKTEEALKQVTKQAKEDKYFELLKEELDKLETELVETKKSDLQANKQEIKEILEYEIVKRYYFDKGKVEVTFDDDKDLAKALSILANTAEYNKILGK
jgi:carboxyl-terminal processing protease